MIGSLESEMMCDPAGMPSISGFRLNDVEALDVGNDMGSMARLDEGTDSVTGLDNDTGGWLVVVRELKISSRL